MKVSITIHHINGIIEPFTNVVRDSIRLHPETNHIRFVCPDAFGKPTIVSTNAEYVVRETED